MWLVATRSDGWTEDGLRWRLEVLDGRADLEARWYDAPSPLHATLLVDEGPIRSALPLIAGMSEDYEAPVEDQETRRLLVEDGGISLRRRVYGASFLLAQFPEVRGFVRFWEVLERTIEGSLPDRFRAEVFPRKRKGRRPR